VLAAAMMAQLAWRSTYYGDLLPNTAYAKVALNAWTFQRGIFYSAIVLATCPSIFVAVALPLWGWRRLDAAGRSLAFSAWWMCGLTLAYTVAVGGDFMAMGRFFVPSLPFTAILFALGVRELSRRGPRGERIASVVAFACIASSLLPAFDLDLIPERVRWALHFRHRFGAEGQSWSEFAQWRMMKQRTENWSQLGRALKLHSKPDDSLASATIGAVGYYSGLTIYDLCGLVSREVARRPIGAGGRAVAGHEKCVEPQFFLDRRPTFLQAQFLDGAGAFPVLLSLPGYRQEFIPLQASDGFPPGAQLAVLRRE
jgi:hypothetical protein